MAVFDSNILIYHLDDALPPDARDQVDTLIVNGAAISVITRIEVLGFPMTADARQQAEDLLAQFDETPLQEAIVQRTILVRQQHRVRLPDAVIAATALERGVPLVTRNVRDFQGIPGLTLLNPFAP